MADYASMFNPEVVGGDPNTVKSLMLDNSQNEALTPTAVPWYQDPDKIRMLAYAVGKVGAGMSEKGSAGEAMGNVAAQMSQAQAVNTAQNKMGGAPVTQTSTTPANNVAAIAQKHKDYAALIDKAGKFNSTGFGFEPIKDAFAANPTEANNTNPTVPVAGSFSEQPSTGVIPTAQSFGPSALPESVAMTMTPEQVTGAYNYNLTSREQTNKDLAAPGLREGTASASIYHRSEAAYKNWQMSPEGQAFTLRHAGEPSRAAAESEKMKTQFALSEIEKLPIEIRNKPVAGTPYTFEQISRMGILSPHGVSAVAAMEDVKVRADATRENARIAADARKDQRADSLVNIAIKQIEGIDRQIDGLIKKQSVGEFPDTPEGQQAKQLAMAMGNIRSADTDIQLRTLLAQKNMIARGIPGWVSTPLPTTVIPPPKQRTITLKDLKETVGTKKDHSGQFQNLFNPSGGTPSANPGQLFNQGGGN